MGGAAVNITLPFPPSANRYYRHDRGITHRSDEANAYRGNVWALCDDEGIEPFSGLVRVSMTFFRPAKRGDLDNRIKVLLDSIQGLAYHNDSQIAEIHAYRADDKANPRVELEITEL
ncbi:MAG: RusA family crossover junction endodeoxyribonuclease [Verrucomicrobia bacterium]|nr:MAG: RusA family crossover junction endodeoxyribonuclease [Verrucomicrobiota bacterium]